MSVKRPYKVRCWEKFLESCGCKFKKNNGSHHIWDCPNCFRPIVFHGHKKELPFLHIKTCLRTMNVDVKEFVQWVNANC